MNGADWSDCEGTNYGQNLDFDDCEPMKTARIIDNKRVLLTDAEWFQMKQTRKGGKK